MAQICAEQIKSLGEKNSPTAGAAFQTASGSLLPTEMAEEITYDSSAVSDFHRLQSALNACHSTSQFSDGPAVNVEFDRVPFPALGDQSAAWSMSEHLSIASISASIVVVRKGNYVVLLVLFGSDSGTTSTLKGLADMAIGKVN